jgi:cell division protein FtsZ
MQNSGNALLGIGYGAWEKRAVDAARKAIENPLLETNIDKAKSIIFAVSWWTDLTPNEVQEAASVIEEIIDPEVNMIWGMSFDETMEDEVQVTIIATWFEEQSKDPVIKTPDRDLLWRPTSTRRITESFIDRAVRTSTQNEEKEETEENNQQWREDLETPAFIRKRLNNE